MLDFDPSKVRLVASRRTQGLRIRLFGRGDLRMALCSYHYNRALARYPRSTYIPWLDGVECRYCLDGEPRMGY